jgi:hypothetical protein
MGLGARTAQVVEHLPRKHEFNLHTAKKKHVGMFTEALFVIAPN